MTHDWLEGTPWYPYGPTGQGFECDNGVDWSYYVGPKFVRPWLTNVLQSGPQQLVPPCCGRTMCQIPNQMGDHFDPTNHFEERAETFALVWMPTLGNADKHACIRLTFHPIDECHPAAAEVPYPCTIDTPLDFAVCYNGATPDSVGWKGVKQVELAPWSPEGK